MADARPAGKRYRRCGPAIVMIGLSVLALAGLADVVGLGDVETFGPLQVAGVVFGGIAFAAGLALQLLPVPRGEEGSGSAP